jgi:hypothetical protein
MAGRYFQCATLLAGLRIEQSLVSAREKGRRALEVMQKSGLMLFHGNAFRANAAAWPVERRLARKAP